MHFLGYILVYGLLWLLHLLPRPILGLFSDAFYVLLYHIARYRRKVVMHNLGLAFPDWDTKRKSKVAKAFYHHLADMMLESAVSHFDSEKQLLRRMCVRNPEVLEELHREGKQVVAITAHYGNWEFLCTVGHYSPYQVLAAYKPLKNKYFDGLIKGSRERFNTLTLPMEKIARAMIEHKQKGIPAFSIFVADQRPAVSRTQFWTKFLGQDTAFFIGSEKMARKIDAAVVFAKIRKLKRFSYEIEFELVCKNPSEMGENEITESHVRILENLIREEPAFWLWSHKRWKHSYEDYLRLSGRSSQ